MRRVIVVVLPVPAPARMQTGPRVASTAARCSSFSPANIRSAFTRTAHRSPRVGRIRSRSGLALRIPDDRAQLRNHLERVALVGQPLELGELLLQPLVVDARPRQPPDLGMVRVPD